jgi:ribose/xylose/arabinose/galactoside ABC-type transport system permease subunit
MTRKPANILARNRRFIPLSVTILLFFVVYAIGMLFYPGMRDPQVFFNLFRTSPFLLISAIGMTFVIISGGIDLSVSGVVALTTVASADLLRDAGWNPWAVIFAMLAMGMAMGAIMAPSSPWRGCGLPAGCASSSAMMRSRSPTGPTSSSVRRKS